MVTKTQTTNPLGIGTVCDDGTLIARIIQYTPEEAQEILASRVHPRQRPVNSRQIERFLKSMDANKWDEPPYTFDVIAYDEEGRVVNGRHRLLALSKQAKPHKFIVLFGIKVPDGKALPTGDTGTARAKWLVEGVQKELWQIANFLLSFATNNKEARAEGEIVAVSQWISEAFDKLPRSHRTVPTPVRAAFVAQWLLYRENPAKQAEIENDWREYSQLNLNVLDAQYTALFKRLDSRGIAKGESDREVQFACTTYALNNPGAAKIYVNIAKTRMVVAELMRRAGLIGE